MKDISGLGSNGETGYMRVLNFRTGPAENTETYRQDSEPAVSAERHPTDGASIGNAALLFPFLTLGQGFRAEPGRSGPDPREGEDFTECDPQDHGAASCLSDLISSAQLRLAHRLGRHAGVDAEKEAERLYGLRLGELSRRGAETVIERLQFLADASRSSVRQAV